VKNKKRIFAVCALCLAFSILVGMTQNISAMMINTGSSSALRSITMNYEGSEEGLVTDTKYFDIDVEAGKNYKVTLTFTGVGESNTTVSFGYDNVTDDQIVPNVVGNADRSGLLGESAVPGMDSVRVFNVAAVNDTIRFVATGQCQVKSIVLEEIETTPADKITVYTIGDSLVQTYTERYAPQTGWGQMLQMYFTEDVVCKNYAIGGRSTGNFLRQGRLNEVLVNLKEGDFVFIQFGHNDATVGNEDRYVSVEDYKINLKEKYIKAIEQRGAIPVLCTLANRNDYNTTTGVFNVSFSNYVEAMKEVAAETGTLLIDLNAKTREAFTAINKELGVGATDDLIYNHGIAGAYAGDYLGGVADNTHLQGYGARLAAGMVAEGVKELAATNEDMARLANYYVPWEVDEVPEAPTNIQKKTYTGFISRIKWKASENADYYKVYVANVTDGVAGEYKIAGYTTVCDFAYDKAAVKHDYAYKVVAVNAAGESAESEVFIFEAASSEKTTKGPRNDLLVVEEDTPFPVGLVVGIAAAVVAVVGIVVAIIVMKKKKVNK